MRNYTQEAHQTYFAFFEGEESKLTAPMSLFARSLVLAFSLREAIVDSRFALSCASNICFASCCWSLSQALSFWYSDFQTAWLSFTTLAKTLQRADTCET